MRSTIRRSVLFAAVVLSGILSISYLVLDNSINHKEKQDNSFDNFIARRALYAESRERIRKIKNGSLEDGLQESKRHSEKQLDMRSEFTEENLDVKSVILPSLGQNTTNVGPDPIPPASLSVVKDSVRDIVIQQIDPSVSGRTNCSSLLRDDTFIRNCLTGDVIGRLPDGMKTSPIRVPRGLAPEMGSVRQSSFEKVFETRAWGHGWDTQNTGLNASGMGATLHWSQEVIGTLHVLIERIKRERAVSRVRLLDVPCGDMAWISRFLKTRNDIDYTGVDIVPSIIEHHQRTYAGLKAWKFERRDILEQRFEEKFDIILCRTLMQHLYTHDVMRLLKQFSDSGSSFLLTTSFDRVPINSELEIGEPNPGRFRKLNLQISPISLVPPLCISRDGPPDAFEGWDHFIGLWTLPLRQVRRCTDSVKFKLTNTDIDIFSCTDWSLFKQS